MIAIPKEPAPHDGKRLSIWRVLFGITVVAAIAAVAVFGYRFFVVDSARAGGATPWFAGYVDTTLTPKFAFENPETPAGTNVVLAFVVAKAADDCTPSWGGSYSLDAAGGDLDLDRRIARVRQLGGDAVVSFGGATNTELATACADVDQLKNAYGAVVDRYDLSTIDLDIESDDLADSVAGERRAAALAALQAERREAGGDLAVWLTLPTMPTGLLTDGLRAVSQTLAAGVDLAGVNIMTMDYGIDREGTMGEAAIDALNAVHSQLGRVYAANGTDLTDATLWAKLGATPMIGQNDVAGEVFTLDDAAELNAFGKQKQLGRLSAWSLNRDRSCGPNYLDVATVSNLCSGVDQGDHTFAETLGRHFTGSPSAIAGGQTTRANAVTNTPEPATVAPSGTPVPSRGQEWQGPVDDPASSPYPIWSPTATYLAGAKVVWHGTVFEAKWWSLGNAPDDPVAAETDTPWLLIGPVLEGETPYAAPTLPAGTFPDWSGTETYEEGARVLFRGAPFVAKWWTQGDSPAAAAQDSAASPWQMLSSDQVAEIAGG